MSSVPRPEDSRGVAPHEETIIGNDSGGGSGSGSQGRRSESSFFSGGDFVAPTGAPPTTAEEFAHSLTQSGLLSRDELNSFIESLPAHDPLADANALADLLVQAGKLTPYQAEALRQGRTRGLVLGNYVIQEKLGAGGMGLVFKARHRVMKRVVALKVLPPSLTQSPDAVARFHREVEAAAKLQYTNIAGAFDADQADGIHFLVLEYIDGANLSALVKEAGPLTPPLATNIIAQAARGLLHAHENGVVHRDIKPGNLLVSKEGIVKILDMGLAQLQSSDDNDGTKAELTQSGRIMGTVDYMAPEQALDAKAVDQRADIYSLGCTLFYLLTGRPLSPEGTLTQKLLWHQTEPVPTLRAIVPEVSDELAAIFQKMTAKKPEDRFGTMGELLKQLEPLLAAIPAEQLLLPSYGVGLSKETGSSTDHGGRGKVTLVEGGTRSDAAGALGWQDSHRPAVTPLATKRDSRKTTLLLAAAGLIGALGIASGIGIFMLFSPPGGKLVADQGEQQLPPASGDEVPAVEKVEPAQPTPTDAAPVASSVPLLVVASQAGARVFVDGVEKGQTGSTVPYQVTVEVPTGKRTIRIDGTGKTTYQQTLQVAPGSRPKVLAALRLPNPKLIVRTTTPGATLRLLGAPYALQPVGGSYEVVVDKLGPGQRTFSLTADGYIAHVEEVNLVEAETLEFDIVLKEQPHKEALSMVFAKVRPRSGVHAQVSYGKSRGVERSSWDGLGMPISEVQAINLAGTALTDQDLALLATIEELESLNLAKVELTDAGLKSLSSLKQLKKLDLSETTISDASLARLSEMTTLVELNLANTRITNAGLDSLAKLTNLETLQLSGTNIDDTGIAKLIDNRKLKLLKLDATQGTIASFSLFAKAFTKNPIPRTDFELNQSLARMLLNGQASIAIVPEASPETPPVTVTMPAELPKEPIRIVGIFTKGSDVVDDKLVREIDGLKYLAELDLTDSRVTDEGLTALRRLRSLKKLNLGSLRLSKKKVEALAKALPHLGDGLVWQGPRDRAAALWVLERGGKVVTTDSEGRLLSDAASLPTNGEFELMEVHFTGKSQVTDADLAMLKDLPSLFTLNLVGCSDLSEEGLKLLKGDRGVRVLCLAGEKMTSKALPVIAERFPHLERLYVADTAIGGQDFASLKELPKLHYLSLAGTRLNDDDLLTLQELPKLLWLSLDGLPLTDKVVPLLAKLKNLKVLSFDDRSLSYNEGLLDDGLLPRPPARSEVLISDMGIEHLKNALKDCRITHPGLSPQRVALRWVLDRGGSATIIDSRSTEPTRIAKQDELPRGGCRVVRISLRGCQGLDPVELSKHLRACKEITLLDLSDMNLGNQDLPLLSTFSNLELLNLGNNPIKDEVFEQIAALPNLQVLGLAGTQVTGRPLQQHPLPKLSRLIAHHTDFNDAGLRGLSKSPNLVDLDVHYCPAITNRGVAELVGLNQLARLNLNDIRLTDDAGASIAQLKSLKWLAVSSPIITDALVSPWKDLPLEHVHLDGTRVTDATLAHLAEFKTLKSISAKGTPVTDAGVQALQEKLGKSVTVSKSADPAPRDENTSGTTGRFGGF